jgi:hypothetical protein
MCKAPTGGEALRSDEYHTDWRRREEEGGGKQVALRWLFSIFINFILRGIVCMINGVTPSGARAVHLTHLAHCRRLQQIEAHPTTPHSHPDLLLALRTRRHNHVLPSSYSSTPVVSVNTVPAFLHSTGLAARTGELSPEAEAAAHPDGSQRVQP